jgi:tRNA A37 threonylcarbamoyltransferase TsaD
LANEFDGAWDAPYIFCTDNAAMVAALGYQHLLAGDRLDLDADVFSRG